MLFILIPFLNSKYFFPAMKRSKYDSVASPPSPTRLRLLHFLIGFILVYYFLLITTHLPGSLRVTQRFDSPPTESTQFSSSLRVSDRVNAPPAESTQIPSYLRVSDRVNSPTTRPVKSAPLKPIIQHSNFVSNLSLITARKHVNSSVFSAAMHAWRRGRELWARSQFETWAHAPAPKNETVSGQGCPEAVLLSRRDLGSNPIMVKLPCGLTLGSHITILGQAYKARVEKERGVVACQFIVELVRDHSGGGNDDVELEKLVHFNPRIKGDWSNKAVIEMNNCYRGQWGVAVRCDGHRSSFVEETVDGQVKCEEWKHDSLEESKAKWLEKMVGQREKARMEWTFPFSEDKFFVLTLNAGLEGYHISVDGRHIASFAYRNGVDLEDALLFYVYGDVNVHSIFAASLPTSLSNVAPGRHLEMSAEWKAVPLPNKPILLFIGVISSGDHFAERMAVRKSWMQHFLIKSSIVVARFFVALHEKEAINVELTKEAEFFGDIIIIPYLDKYNLLVLKTLAICEYGVNMLSTKYIMKCDDDTFVRVDTMIEETKGVDSRKSLYLGKLNYYHQPLRTGKWAVTHEEWPSQYYPPYADGPGYIVSSDIARLIISEFEKARLKLSKMEDVSMGMWVEQFNRSKHVEYVHNSQFYQFGCADGYYTAHYQSPKQLICLWEKLQTQGKPICCNL